MILIHGKNLHKQKRYKKVKLGHNNTILLNLINGCEIQLS